jgi:hypothetical protein
MGASASSGQIRETKFTCNLGIGISALLIVLLAMLFSSADASNKLKRDDQVRLAIIKHLAEDPRRLNAEYLRYIFGMPAVKDKEMLSLDREFDWREPINNQQLCQLNQSADKKSGEFSSRFTLPLPNDSKIDYPAVQSLLDIKPKQHFNQQGFPAATYQVSSTTNVIAVRRHNRAMVHEIIVEYKGAPLPAPSVKDLKDAKVSLRKTVLADYGDLNRTEAVSLLAAYLREFPDDAEVRIRLAEVYKANGSISEAINQYQLALSKASGDQELKARCLEGLHQMKVILPASAYPQSNAVNSSAGSANSAKTDRLYVGF